MPKNVPQNLMVSPEEYSRGAKMAQRVTRNSRRSYRFTKLLALGIPFLTFLVGVTLLLGISYKPEYFGFIPGQWQAKIAQLSFYLPLPKTKHQLLASASINSKYLRNYEQKFFVETFLQKPNNQDPVPSFQGFRSDGAINLINPQKPQLEQSMVLLSSIPGDLQFEVTTRASVINGKLYFKIDDIPGAIRDQVDPRIEAGNWYEANSDQVGIYQQLRNASFDRIFSSWFQILSTPSYEPLVMELGLEQVNNRAVHHFRLSDPGIKRATLLTEAYKTIFKNEKELDPDAYYQIRALAQKIETLQYDTWIDAQTGYPTRNLLSLTFNTPVEITPELGLPLQKTVTQTPLTKLTIGWDATNINEPFIFTPPTDTTAIEFATQTAAQNPYGPDADKLDTGLVEELTTIGTALEASYFVNGERYPGGLNELVREGFVKSLPGIFTDLQRLQYLTTIDKATIIFRAADSNSSNESLWQYQSHDDVIEMISEEEYYQIVERFNAQPDLSKESND